MRNAPGTALGRKAGIAHGQGKGEGQQGLWPQAQKKCCRKKTRCLKCPVVIMRMKKLENEGATKKELSKGLKKARAA